MIYLLDGLVYLIAWVFQGFTGFGAGIFIVGILSLYHDPRTVVVSSAVVNLVGVVSVVLMLARRSRPCVRVLIPLIVGSVPGIFLGTEVLFRLDRDLLRFSIGIFIVLLGLYDLAVQKGVAERVRLKESVVLGVVFGFLGGFFAGLVGIGGPPPVVYLNQITSDINRLKVTLNLFFVSNIFFRTVFYTLEGGAGSFDLMMILPSFLFVPLGVFLGVVISNRFSSRTVKQVISLSVVLLGSALVLRETLW
ncbi:MAG: sulfite exporter TauE/SafE family protein [Aquificota bacterium]|nr:sulfite exporter TauE/SafE family protein [Aquificota bacterium]